MRGAGAGLTMDRVRSIAALAVAVLVLAGCGDGNGGGVDAGGCQEAVSRAAEAANMPERKQRLQPAFEACENLAEFTAAVARYPKALEDIDVEAYVREQCEKVEALRDAALCEALG